MRLVRSIFIHILFAMVQNGLRTVIINALYRIEDRLGIVVALRQTGQELRRDRTADADKAQLHDDERLPREVRDMATVRRDKGADAESPVDAQLRDTLLPQVREDAERLPDDDEYGERTVVRLPRDRIPEG
jgi:hypothetical protein